jgi:5-methylcytosine-specific restriction protein A
MRTVPEWIGKSDDSAVPPRVVLRVLEAYAYRCYLSHRPIGPGDEYQIEHIIAIALGGQNRESNLAPVLIEPHKVKTRADTKAKAKIARIKKGRFGLKKPKRPMMGSRASGWKRNFDGTAERRT